MSEVPTHVLEARLDPAQFAPLHRSAIVNLDRVREIVHDRRGGHVVVLVTGNRSALSPGDTRRLTGAIAWAPSLSQGGSVFGRLRSLAEAPR